MSERNSSFAYWLTQLSGDRPELPLGGNREPAASPSNKGAVHVFEIGPELTRQIRELGRYRRITTYVILLAAFATLLFRYSGQSDIVVGTPFDARNRPELESIFGYLLSTIPIRTRPSAQMSFLTLLTQTENTVLDASEAANVSFNAVERELRKLYNTTHPLFQVFFSMRPPEISYPDGWALNFLDVGPVDVKFDLYLEMMEKPDVIESRFFYRSDLFDADTVSSMTEHWLTLLKSICESPEKTLSKLSIMCSEEYADVLRLSQGEATASSVYETTIQAMFQSHVQQRPQARAALSGDKWLTYADLDRRVQMFEQELRTRGIGPGSVVVVALERCFDLLIVMLGVMSVRAAYLPVDVNMPRERIIECLADTQPELIVTHGFTAGHVNSGSWPVFIVDHLAPEVDQHAQSFSERSVDRAGQPDDSAYVIYTSGTTGKPKAVEIPQRSLVNVLTAMQHTPGFTSDDVMLAITTVSFDIAILELLLPIVSGGTVVLASRQEAQDPFLLGSLIDNTCCTVVQATPTTWRNLMSSTWASERSLRASGFRIWCGGEALTEDLAGKLLAIGAEVWNLYGPTETTIWSTIERVCPENNGVGLSVSVGRPIANTQAYILGVDQELLPIGVSGELLIGGVGLAKGYRGRQDLTLERFHDVQSPIKSRLYRTGDRAVRRRNGSIEIRGRIDNQVKIRGHRVELEAVEAIVERHPLVTAAAAQAWPESDGAKRLAVYITVNGHPPSHTDLREFLAHKMPDYMVPSDIVVLSSLPLNASGKLDRVRLPKPQKKLFGLSDACYKAMTAHERRVAALWLQLLPLSQVDANDNFFSLGGHSIDVAALVTLVHDEFRLKISMAELFHKPTIREQSELIRSRQNGYNITTPGVLTLQAEGSGTPMYWIHYVNEGLAHALGNKHPFVSVVLTKEDVVALGDDPTIESMAMLHVRKLLAAAPTGPYIIGGFCVGGLLAYEVARLLSYAGHQVSLLVLVDVPNSSTPFMKKSLRYGRWLVGEGGVKALKWSIRNRIGAYQRGEEQVTDNEMRTVQLMAEHAAVRFKPSKYGGNVSLIQASERLHMDLFAAWKDVSPNLRTRYVDGHHDDLMKRENLHKVGSAIRSELESNHGTSAVTEV